MLKRTDYLESVVNLGNRKNSRAAYREICRIVAIPKRRKHEKRGRN